MFQKSITDGIGCKVMGEYLDILGYADDLVLLSPTRNRLQKMINTVEKFANEKNIVFSTNINKRDDLQLRL